MKSPAVGLVNFLRDESGAAAAEYGMLIAALLVIRDAADCVEVGCL
jgi:hypothetical protein